MKNWKQVSDMISTTQIKKYKQIKTVAKAN